MPFKSKKQKKTIDAAAHNPAFAKKVGIKTSDAKKMSAHGKGQTKFGEAVDTVEKDEKGNVKSWKHEGDWKKSDNKNPRGKVTHASDVAQRKTAKLSKPEKEMAEQFEKALEGKADLTIKQGANKGKQWSPKTPGVTNKDFDPRFSPPDGATAPPPGYKAPKAVKKAEVDTSTNVAATEPGDDTEVTASMKRTGKKVSEAKKEKEPEGTYSSKRHETDGQRIARLAKEKRQAQKKKDEKVAEGLKGKQKELDVAEPKGKLTGADFKALKGKKKVKESTETQLLRIAKQAMDTVKALREARAEEARIKHMPISESDEYFTGLQSRLNKQIKG